MAGKIIPVKKKRYKAEYEHDGISPSNGLVIAMCSFCDEEWTELESRRSGLTWDGPCPVCTRRVEQFRRQLMSVFYVSNEIAEQEAKP
jgi:hypothetical protein